MHCYRVVTAGSPAVQGADPVPDPPWSGVNAAAALSGALLIRRPDQQESYLAVDSEGGPHPVREDGGRACRRQASMRRRPSNARPSVTSSAYSRSPPTGSPLASRETASPIGETSRAR